MKGRILVVDDEPDMRLLLRLALRGAGYEIEEAVSGEEALGADAGDLDLVLLDLNLPGINGLEVLEAWGRAGVIEKLPVLMLTADARPGVEDRARELGAADFLTKPIQPADLVAAIERAIRRDPAPPATVESS